MKDAQMQTDAKFCSEYSEAPDLAGTAEDICCFLTQNDSLVIRTGMDKAQSVA